MNKYGYTSEETELFKRLNTPARIQDYINSLPFNFEEKGETCMSPREVLKAKKAHCMEGALLAGAILEFHGHKPIVLDLRSVKKPFDYDHVLALFKVEGFFGSISKTNHAVLRYREPVYKSVRELVMSFFHEYFSEDGRKTLREYSNPLHLSRFNRIAWRTSEDDLFEIPDFLDQMKHHKILSHKQIKGLRKLDLIEIKASWEEEYKNS